MTHKSLPIVLLVLFAALAACSDESGTTIPDRGGDSGATDTTPGEDATPSDTGADAVEDGTGGDVEPGEDATDTTGTPDTGCLDGAVRPCFTGPPEQENVGTCSSGLQTCADGVWGACDGESVAAEEFCDGLDNDCDGVVDDGVANACGVCGAAQIEVCDDGLDNDCNGTIDDVTEGCACGGRLDQPCYSGPPHTLGVGLCTGGTFDCVEGAWGPCRDEVTPVEEICDDLDNDCDGLVDEGTRNACGECGLEAPPELCDGLDNDCDGLVDEEVRGLCGLCLDEVGDEICGDGFDNDCDGAVDEDCVCAGEEACYPGPPDALGVGQCQAGTRVCDPSGEFWGACEGFVLPGIEVCDEIDNDCDGTIDLAPSGCSLCGTEPEVCDGVDNDCNGQIDEGLLNACGQCIADVIPEETLGPEYCDGLDDDCDGLIDEGLLNECGTCDEDDCSDCEFFVEGWSDTERCGDGQDNDGNGEADEGCPCDFGTTQRCFLGPPNSRRIGACLDGTQTCVNRDDPRWGPCEGGVLPSEEVCDEKDNDCNGCIDDGAACDIVISCPVEDITVPLQNYDLIGSAIYTGDAPVDAWRWTVDPPAGSATTGPANPNAMNTSFYVDVSGDYRITVEITIDGEVYTCSWILHAQGSGLRVELIWDTFGTVDLDLHLHRPGSTANWCDSADDCFYANCDDGESPPWGYPDSAEGCPDGASSCRNPRLDIDNIRGYDPENINIDNPNDGDSFRIMVHAYSEEDGVGTSYPEVRIYCGGFLSAEIGVAPDRVEITDANSRCRGDTWRVADVTMNVDEETGAATCDVDVLSGSGAGGWDIRNDDTRY